jgi:hypothetical protein
MGQWGSWSEVANVAMSWKRQIKSMRNIKLARNIKFARGANAFSW